MHKSTAFMKYVAFSILCIFMRSSFAQNINYIDSYHKVLLEGDLQMLEHDYDSALYFYQKAFSAVPYAFCFDYLSGSWVAHKAKRDDLALTFLDSAVVRGLYIEKIPRFCFKNKAAWNAYKEYRYPELYEKGMSRHNQVLLKYVDSLLMVDQSIRGENISDDELIILSKVIDSTNLIAIQGLIDNGQIGESSLGFNASGEIFVLLLHGAFLDQELMYNLYSNGFISKRTYFYSVMRNVNDFGIPVKYSTKNSYKSSSEIDSFRLKDGLPTMKVEKKLKRIKNRYYYPI